MEYVIIKTIVVWFYVIYVIYKVKVHTAWVLCTVCDARARSQDKGHGCLCGIHVHVTKGKGAYSLGAVYVCDTRARGQDKGHQLR